MGIVELEGCLLIELADVAVMLLVFRDRRLYAGGDKEILLLQTQLLACIVLVSRIQDLNDILRQVLLLHSLHIFALVEMVKLEVVDGLRIPYTQGVYNPVSISDDGDIKGYGTNGLIVPLDKLVLACGGVVLNFHVAAEFYFLGVLRAAQLKGIAVL